MNRASGRSADSPRPSGNLLDVTAPFETRQERSCLRSLALPGVNATNEIVFAWAELKNVPGRKTDMLDCQWLQRLHGSFRPHEAVVRLRTLHRQLGNLVAERMRLVRWM